MASRDKRQAAKQDDSGKAELMHRLKTRPGLFIGSVLILIIITIAFVFVPALGPGTFQMSELTFGYYNRIPIRYTGTGFFNQVLQHELGRRQQELSPDNPNYIRVLTSIWQGPLRKPPSK